MDLLGSLFAFSLDPGGPPSGFLSVPMGSLLFLGWAGPMKVFLVTFSAPWVPFLFPLGPSGLSLPSCCLLGPLGLLVFFFLGSPLVWPVGLVAVLAWWPSSLAVACWLGGG